MESESKPPATVPGGKPGMKPGMKPGIKKVSRPKTTDAEGKPQQPEGITYVATKFSPVYLSKWNGDQEICGICKNEFLRPCLRCEGTGSTEPCPTAQSTCGHIFHLHCINEWARTRGTCPICIQKWEQI